MGITAAQTEIDNIIAKHGEKPKDPEVAARLTSLGNRIQYLRRKNQKKTEKALIARREAAKSPAATQAKIDGIQAKIDRKTQTLDYYKSNKPLNEAYYTEQISKVEAQIKALKADIKSLQG